MVMGPAGGRTQRDLAYPGSQISKEQLETLDATTCEKLTATTFVTVSNRTPSDLFCGTIHLLSRILKFKFIRPVTK